jgi:hypothetical protein
MGEFYNISTINHNIKAILRWISDNYPPEKQGTLIKKAIVIMITEKTKNMSDEEKIKFACHTYKTQQLIYCKNNIPTS